jgi:hypothetical protein
VGAPWAILELAEGATLAELKAAHRRLSRRYHPDMHAGESAAVQEAATLAMAAINLAYAELVLPVPDDTAHEEPPVPQPATSIVRRHQENRWDAALATAPELGHWADLAA